MSTTLGELAKQIDAELHGDPDCRINNVATLEQAGPGDISFLSNTRYRKYLKTTGASAVILAPEELSACPVNALVLENPYLGYARVATLLHPVTLPPPGIDATASIHESAQVAGSACIKNRVVIGADARIGDHTVIEPGVFIGEGVQIGSGCHIYPNVVLMHSVKIGNNVILHPGVVIGSDGFGIANDAGKWVKIPQVGKVVIGDNVEIGSNSTIDRGAIDDTVIGDGVKIDNLVQIGHNVHIGDDTAIAGCVGISGSSRIGKRCMIGGAAGIGGHLSITDDVIITGFSMVTKSVLTPGLHSSGIPLTENLKWRKNVARFQHLDELYKRVAELERKGREDQ
ncbi:MAG: UDP-3-O-(3-hydroxymyristoyl)glucosamine N-acyltransferase [Gammaproteobacteria bacterium]|nr:UDP-3-O-(3-hydroxymyristoyl)glucosamine N-acyltransferase [Gammaproteobacteria bacterium]